MSALSLVLALLAAPDAAGEPALAPRELAPGVHALPSQASLGSTNAGWAAAGEETVLIGPFHPKRLERILADAARTTGKPPRTAILLGAGAEEAEAGRVLREKGLRVLSPSEAVRAFGTGGAVEVILPDPVLGAAAVHLPRAGVLFAGALVSNGPRAVIGERSIERWIGALRALEKLPARTVVPGAGTIGGPEVIARARGLLEELRRQVAYLVCQGRPLEPLRRDVQIEAGRLVWMPYDHPPAEDIDAVYRELTVPRAPFGVVSFTPGDNRPRALALVGDRFHEPGHIEGPLGATLERAGAAVRFTFDSRAVTAENLRQVQLLVLLKDGALWPEGADGKPKTWMEPAAEKAVVEFVEGGGALLALHNSPGLYPEGPYLRLIGATFRGHGPPEEFRVEVTDPKHPIARGISDFQVADEQHTPLAAEGVQVFLRSRSEDGFVAPAGWSREAGKGRVVYLANGHFRETLLHPMVSRLFENGARWCLRREGPDS